MRDAYFFTITNNRKFSYSLFANCLYLISFSFYALYRYQIYQTEKAASFGTGILIPGCMILLLIIRFYFILKNKNKRFTNLHVGLLAGSIWLFLNYWLPAFLLILLAITESIANTDTVCTIDKNGIRFSGMNGKKYLWSQLAHVMLKDGIFTIDQKNNRILQLDISTEIIPFKEPELQQFIKRYLPV
jgi:hypothetical protein